MTVLSIRQLPFLPWSRRNVRSERRDRIDIRVRERRVIVSQMIAAGACESEFGVQMLMAALPKEY